MKEIKNEVLRNIIEGLPGDVEVQEEIISYLDDGMIAEHMEDIVTELSLLLSSEAGIEWYELIYQACCKNTDQDMWAHAIAEAFSSGAEAEKLKEVLRHAKSPREFKKLSGKAEENELHDTVAQSDPESEPLDYAEQVVDIAEKYIEKHVAPPMRDISDGMKLVELALNVRDRLKEYEDRIAELNGVVESQKCLIDSQTQKIKLQDTEITDKTNLIELQKKQLEQMRVKSEELSKTLQTLESIQTGICMIGHTG